MSFDQILLIGCAVIIIVMAIVILILQERVHQRDGYCSRMTREANEWQKKYQAERAKNRRPRQGQN